MNEMIFVGKGGTSRVRENYKCGREKMPPIGKQTVIQTNETLNYYDQNATSFSESTLHVNFTEKLFADLLKDISGLAIYHVLEKNMMPVYDSARRQGYEIWNY